MWALQEYLWVVVLKYSVANPMLLVENNSKKISMIGTNNLNNLFTTMNLPLMIEYNLNIIKYNKNIKMSIKNKSGIIV